MMKNELLWFTTRLIRYKSTTSRPVELQRCAHWIASQLKRSCPEGVRIAVALHNGIPTVLAVRGQWKQPDVLLHGHFDVIDAASAQFIPASTGDRVYGRGAADMKAGVAALMTTFVQTVQQQPDLSIGLMLTGDEEIGGNNGTEWLVRQGWKTKLLINLDGGYGEEISIAEKGILRFTMIAKGKRAKYSYPWQGSCAFEKIVGAYNTLHALFPERHRANDAENWHTTFAAHEVHTVSQPKSTVETASLFLTVHFTQDMSCAELLKTIQHAVPQVHIIPTLLAERVSTPGNHPAVQAFRRAYKKQLGHTPPLRRENGSSDARFFTHLNIPIIITKPVSGNAEQDNEWVSLRSTEKLTRTLIEFLHTVRR